MSVIEFIGFIISMAAMGFLYLKRMQESRYRAEHPEEFADEQQADDEDIRNFLRSAHAHRHEERASLPHRPAEPPKQLKPAESKPLVAKQPIADKPLFQSSMAGYRQAAEVENRRLQSSVDKHQGSALAPFVSRNLGYTEAKYEVEYLRQDSRAGALIRQQHSLQDMFILKEILGPPKAMQKAWADPLALPDEQR